MTSELKPDWHLIKTDMGKVIFHCRDKEAAKRVAEKHGSSITPLYEARRPISAEAVERCRKAVHAALGYPYSEDALDHAREKRVALAVMRALGHEVEEGE